MGWIEGGRWAVFLTEGALGAAVECLQWLASKRMVKIGRTRGCDRYCAGQGLYLSSERIDRDEEGTGNMRRRSAQIIFVENFSIQKNPGHEILRNWQ